MAIVDILVPQMGEGLQEVLVVNLVRKPGERVRRDEVLYSMETDKATMEVESPHDGVLREWLVEEGDTLPIGAPIARLEVDGAAEAQAASASPAPVAHDLRAIPPRTRAVAREKGIPDDVLVTIPSAGPRLMPEDLDRFLATPAVTTHADRTLSVPDRALIHRLRRSAAVVIPAVARRVVPWDPIRRCADDLRARGGDLQPTSFNCIAWAIVRAVAAHPKFRSTLVREEIVREWNHVNLGIAVAATSGELTTAVVRAADALTFPEFVAQAKERVAAARRGDDQADETVQMHLTYMGGYELTDAIPVLVAPAAGVVFIGAPFAQDGVQVVNLTLTFDHRLVHGVEAAEFLRTVVGNIAEIETLVGG